MNLTKRLRVSPDSKVRLSDWDANDTAGLKKDKAEELLERNIKRMGELEYRLYAEGHRSLLIVLQGMDAAGKDGTIRHVMTGLNPQSCHVTAFKVPSAEEQAHDFLWRIHHAAPGRGEIGIFNRSHYEDVLVVRVHNIVPKEVWSARYEQINHFEKFLTLNGTKVLKFFLHISKDEQRRRLLSRVDDPAKNWKITPADAAERRCWKEYHRAYEDALSHCSTKTAPWFVIPANKKWFRNLAVSQIIVEALEEMDPRLPKPPPDLEQIVIK
jgi:PPK2 family polyphosphate:nucleotide phosphotransferase